VSALKNRICRDGWAARLLSKTRLDASIRSGACTLLPLSKPFAAASAACGTVLRSRRASSWIAIVSLVHDWLRSPPIDLPAVNARRYLGLPGQLDQRLREAVDQAVGSVHADHYHHHNVLSRQLEYIFISCVWTTIYFDSLELFLLHASFSHLQSLAGFFFHKC
jgi:hypothetical protein